MHPRLPFPPCVLAASLLVAGAVAAQPATPRSLADLSLEQLSSLEVTSVGKRVQRLADVPGSVYVITQEDIRRSGAVTLPEVLRLAPNLQVARADANQYAITARGFNSVLANKMLVLMDGRTVYSPLFSGVFWEAQDTMLEDIERIEVLSGASGTLYGSNAVNGVINIVTRNAAETGGLLLKAGAGNDERLLAARWGDSTEGAVHWRAWAKRIHGDATELASGGPVRDAARRSHAGFRADVVRQQHEFSLVGDLHEGDIDQAPAARRISGASLLARWAHDDGAGTRTQLQTFLDRAERRQPGRFDDRLDTWDLEFQQAARPAEAHELLWGAGYRTQEDRFASLTPAALRVLPANRHLQLWNVFAQDEVALTRDLRFTAGLKAEHNSYSGLEWLPNVRLAWQARPGSLLWGALSRAVRVPARVDRDVFVPQLPRGGAGVDSEVARVAEVGWRAQPTTNTAYNVVLFHHRFDRLRSVDLAAGGAGFGNSHHARLTGLEAWGRWRLGDRWRAQASYVHQRLRIGNAPGSTIAPDSAVQLANDPRSRASLGLAWDFAANMEFDAHLRRVGALPNPAVPAYTALDVRWGWRPEPNLELSVAVRNLTDSAHVEWGAAASRAEIGRSVLLKAVWRR